MKCWLKANPKNRKTRKGIERFIVAWLNRSQDKAPRVAVPTKEHLEKVLSDNKIEKTIADAVDEKLLNDFKIALGG